MKYGIVYAVINGGDVVYASEKKEFAEGYAENRILGGAEDVLDGWGNDDPTDTDMAEAVFQAGFDGDYCEVVEVDISDKAEDDVVMLPDGDEIEVSDILKMLKRSESENNGWL